MIEEKSIGASITHQLIALQTIWLAWLEVPILSIEVERRRRCLKAGEVEGVVLIRTLHAEICIFASLAASRTRRAYCRVARIYSGERTRRTKPNATATI